jgi:hypothetical protein
LLSAADASAHFALRDAAAASATSFAAAASLAAARAFRRSFSAAMWHDWNCRNTTRYSSTLSPVVQLSTSWNIALKKSW